MDGARIVIFLLLGGSRINITALVRTSCSERQRLADMEP